MRAQRNSEDRVWILWKTTVRVYVARGSNRVNRGGSWNNDARNCRSSNRNNNTPGNRSNNLGLRLAF